MKAISTHTQALLSVEPLAQLDAVPFTIGLSDNAHNPAPFPDQLPLHLGLDSHTGLIRQIGNEEVRKFLTLAYDQGSLLGTALDETTAGSAYADDFYKFVQSVSSLAGCSVLEIGAGRGYLLKLLKDEGATVLGIEPGHANARYWREYGVRVVEDIFPSSQVKESFDLIIGHALLEHIEEPYAFLDHVKSQLNPGGNAIFVVPDCSVYVAQGDPGMLLHQHWSYFTPASLTAVLARAGFAVTRIAAAGYGSGIYALAEPSEDVPVGDLASGIQLGRSFGEKATALRRQIRKYLEKRAADGGSVGIYVPGRALMWLEPGASVRFFDDDKEIQGRYFPPFSSPVESQAQLLADPVDELWIMSHSFGRKIAARLAGDRRMSGTKIVLIDELRQHTTVVKQSSHL